MTWLLLSYSASSFSFERFETELVWRLEAGVIRASSRAGEFQISTLHFTRTTRRETRNEKLET